MATTYSLNANNVIQALESSTEQRLMDWLLKSKKSPKKYPDLSAAKIANHNIASDDWQTVASICGHESDDFFSAGIGLPLTASEIDYFRRNHRDVDHLLTRDFMVARADLPSPLAELYGLYRHRARVDAEAALFVAQATSSTRVASTMADLLAIGGFANGLEYVTHMTMMYAVSAAFDTSDLVDRTNQEASRRLALPIDHPAHLLTMSPDEIGVLAANIVERNALSIPHFLEKANLLTEARQDVNRMPHSKQFVTAVGERDLPLRFPWVTRICSAYANIFESWVAGTPEIDAVLGHKAKVVYQ